MSMVRKSNLCKADLEEFRRPWHGGTVKEDTWDKVLWIWVLRYFFLWKSTNGELTVEYIALHLHFRRSTNVEDSIRQDAYRKPCEASPRLARGRQRQPDTDQDVPESPIRDAEREDRELPAEVDSFT